MMHGGGASTQRVFTEGQKRAERGKRRKERREEKE